MGIAEPTIIHQIKEHRKDQERQHAELMAAVNQMNQGLAYIASLLERQAPMQGGVFHPAGAQQR